MPNLIDLPDVQPSKSPHYTIVTKLPFFFHVTALAPHIFAPTCKMAHFLGEMVGVVGFGFDLFEVESQESRGWYRRKMGWAREALFGQTKKPTKEWFNRQLHGIEFLLGVLSAARTA